MGLKRHITFSGLYFSTISAAIGSGWLFAPYFAAKLAGPLALLAWILAGCMVLPIVLCFIEMSMNMPVSGGLVRFLNYSHGKFLSFILSWLTWISAVLIPPIEVEATLQYSSYYFPGIIHKTTQHTPLTHFGLLLAMILMLLFVVINSFGVRLLTRVNSVLSIWKVIVPLVAIFSLFATSFHASNFHLSPEPIADQLHEMFMAIATGGILFSLIGFRAAIEMGGEVKSPERNITKAILFGFFTYLFIYTLLQAAFIGAINPLDIANGWKHLHLISDASPLVSIVAAAGIVWLVSILYLDAIISPAGSGLLYSASTARILYAISKTGFLPKIFMKTNKRGVPFYAVIFNFIVGMFLFLPFSGWRQMVTFLVSLSIIAYGLGAVSAYALRKQNREGWKSLPFANVISFIAFYMTCLFVYWTGWKDVLLLFLVNLCGILIFLIYLIVQSWMGRKDKKNQKGRDELFYSLRSAYWYLPFLICLLGTSYFGQFGGTKLIPFGVDFILLALIAVPFYFLACITRLSRERNLG